MNTYPTKLVSTLTQATENQIKYWVRNGLVCPVKIGKMHFYSFRDIIKLRLIVSLKKDGLSLQKIRKGIENLSKVLPNTDKIITGLVIYTNGIDMIVIEKGKHFSAITNQRYLTIDTEKIKTQIEKLYPKTSTETEVKLVQAVV